jgi:Arc/MetJ-type ribon-helix-helix transcriptional regulator
MVLVSVHLPRRVLEELDALVRSGVYPSRSEAVREALRRFIEAYAARA